jgi:hypothetical protein
MFTNDQNFLIERLLLMFTNDDRPIIFDDRRNVEAVVPTNWPSILEAISRWPLFIFYQKIILFLQKKLLSIFLNKTVTFVRHVMLLWCQFMLIKNAETYFSQKKQKTSTMLRQ